MHPTKTPQPIDLSRLTSIVKGQRLLELAKLRAAKKLESVNIYRPQPSQDAFHKSLSPQRILRGGNRAGKTTAGAIEVARAALGLDPHNKYPKRPLLIYLLGYDEGHCGRVFYRVLCRAGLFKIIRDKDTGEWRTFNPETEPEREKEAKPAPPLIPGRFIADIGWKDKKTRAFSVIRLKNGTEIRAFSSNAEPAMGDPVDLVWIDEDLLNEEWVTEMQARLSDLKGRLYWTVKPNMKSDALVRLSMRANEPDNLKREIPDISESILVASDSPYLDKDQMRQRRADFSSMSEEELAARDRGEFATDSILMYPTFHVDLHGAPWPSEYGLETEFDKILGSKQVPLDWTRYASIDPGHSVTCVLFFAVPPPWKYGDHVLLFDELYIKNCDANEFGRRMAEKTSGQRWQAFIIDEHGSRITEAGSGLTVKHQYSEQLRKHRIEAEATHYGFVPGSDDRLGRSMKARSWMSIRDDGTTKFRILKDSCPNWKREIPYYRKRVVKSVVEDLPEPRTARLCHAMAAFEYMVAYGPKYVVPPKAGPRRSPLMAEHMRDLERERENEPGGIWLGAGAGAWF